MKTLKIDELRLIGISYKTSSVETRSKFGLTSKEIEQIYQNLEKTQVLILSTCNRTEIYTYSLEFDDILELIPFSNKEKEEFSSISYKYVGVDALRHLCRVASGLDSQILGDYEITGQLKNAFKLSKKFNRLGGKLEKMCNLSIHISRKIKSKTNINKGIISVSSVAIQYIKENVSDLHDKSVIVIGMGKMGRSVSKNLIDYLNCKSVSLVNRTESVSDKISKELNVGKVHYDSFRKYINGYQIIVVATNSPTPILDSSELIDDNKLVLDLSVPLNVRITNRPNNIKFVNIDELSKITDITLQKRIDDIPKGHEIIELGIDKFLK